MQPLTIRFVGGFFFGANFSQGFWGEGCLGLEPIIYANRLFQTLSVPQNKRSHLPF
jgi:hypothetical protein